MSPQTSELLKVVSVAGCITLVEVVALCKGKNGLMLRIVIIALAGLAGFSLAELIK